MRFATIAVLLVACGDSTTTAVDAGLAMQVDAPVTTAGLVIAPGTADFGDVGVAMDGTPMTFTVTNHGAHAATGLGVATTGPFLLGTENCGSMIAAGATCTVEVIPHPTSVSSLTGTLQIASALELTDAVLTVHPVTVDNLITVAPTAKAFGDVAVTSSAVQTFTVTNTGAAAQGPLQLSFSGSTTFNGASNNHCSGLTLGGGTSCTFDVTFKPTATGAVTGEVDVVGMNTIMVGLSGNGI
jgi:hypothetical protein